MRTTAEVFHAWANQTRGRGRCGNVWFEGDYIYSYNVCIGRWVDDPFTAPETTDAERAAIAFRREIDGPRPLSRVALVNGCKYSATTTRHQYVVRNAVWQQKIELPIEPSDSPTFIVQALVDQAASLLSKSRRAKSNKESLLAEAHTTFASALRVARLFGLPPIASGDLEAALAARADRIESDRLAAVERERERDEVMRVQLAEATQKWLRGGRQFLHGHPDVFLRLRAGGTRIETSRGASVPTDPAIEFWRSVKAGKPLPGVCGYPFRYVRSGRVTVGCHDILIAEMDRIAGLLGVSADVPTDESLLEAA